MIILTKIDQCLSCARWHPFSSFKLVYLGREEHQRRDGIPGFVCFAVILMIFVYREIHHHFSLKNFVPQSYFSYAYAGLQGYPTISMHKVLICKYL